MYPYPPISTPPKTVWYSCSSTTVSILSTAYILKRSTRAENVEHELQGRVDSQTFPPKKKAYGIPKPNKRGENYAQKTIIPLPYPLLWLPSDCADRSSQTKHFPKKDENDQGSKTKTKMLLLVFFSH